MKMTIDPIKVTVRELVDGYKDDGEDGVVGYHGRLDIRPAYQREFVYNPEQRAAVVDTIREGYPLSVMYWMKRADGTFEVLDGQQRTLSICQYVAGDYFVDWDGTPRGFHNLPEELADTLLDYELTVYVCEGTADERRRWFERINIAGERLTAQEILNATYAGPTVTVTLLEHVAFGTGQSEVFDYAYFVNNYGWMSGSSITINGDMRANGNVSLSQSTVNGFVYAAANDELGVTGSVTLRGSPRIKSATAYRSASSTTTRSRPDTNDYDTNGAYDAPAASGVITAPTYDENGNVKSGTVAAQSQKSIVNEESSPLAMPFVSDLENYVEFAKE